SSVAAATAGSGAGQRVPGSGPPAPRRGAPGSRRRDGPETGPVGNAKPVLPPGAVHADRGRPRPAARHRRAPAVQRGPPDKRRRAGPRMSTAGAIQPFEFVGCLELREMLGRAAWYERELLAGIEDVPAGSIWYPTTSYFLPSLYLAAPYPNVFATWAGIQARDRVPGGP